ncbi:PREDICTED: protein SODIUM POTASSIUM ROOT DEFECTIVE 1-like [Ipomoea nil]|uniref:protein SODIUM POTASSIUM ROOT DEFECTIVE 1-like n=1 Tax=Ipomoea nil TaxID=35883 RepID=UPI0009018970|nr:PREDICTED: protein SODIUM POTASSIUM ROOT DEFECTIVE 1-like [Ipomoea nil]
MKSRRDLFCASHASTAICSSMDQRRIVRPRSRPPAPPCSSHLPFHPTSFRKTASSPKDPSPAPNNNATSNSPGHSSRYLLNDSTFLHQILSDSNNTQALVPYRPFQTTKAQHTSGDNLAAVIPSSSSLPPPPPKLPPVVCNPSSLTLDSNVKTSSSSTPTHRNHQVVELRVAIHCKGCEGKVRKHLSKMEGVSSFSIDLDSKKVTVIGNVTPLGVLANISKVKNAQFWPSPATSSPSSPKVNLPIR